MICRFESLIDAPVSEVFAFHERLDAVATLAPPGQKLQVVEKTGGLEVGSRAVLRIPIGPFRIEWIALHTACEKDRLFVDKQVKGPFRKWIHRHEFEAAGRQTRYIDIVDFEFFGGGLTAWAVRLQLGVMFRHRHRLVARAMQSR